MHDYSLDLFAFLLDFFLVWFFFFLGVGRREVMGKRVHPVSSISVPKALICTCKLISNVFHQTIVDGFGKKLACSVEVNLLHLELHFASSH